VSFRQTEDGIRCVEAPLSRIVVNPGLRLTVDALD